MTIDNPFTARAQQAERFRITHLMQGLMILDTYDTCQTDAPWDGVTQARALDAVRRAVDFPTATYWAEQFEQQDTPRPTQTGWTEWRDQQRTELDDDYAAAGTSTPIPAPEDPSYGPWIPGQPKGDDQ